MSEFEVYKWLGIKQKWKDEKNKTSGDVLNSQSSADGKILNDFDFFSSPLRCSWDKEDLVVWTKKKYQLSHDMNSSFYVRSPSSSLFFFENSMNSQNINRNIFFVLITEAVSCNQCSKTQKCLPDLMTHQPKCVICNYKCPRKRRPATVSFFYYRESPFAEKNI